MAIVELSILKYLGYVNSRKLKFSYMAHQRHVENAPSSIA